MNRPNKLRTGRGFRQAGRLVEKRIRAAGESRGFSVARVLTHWDEIVGPDTAQVARPVYVSYGRKGLGATLTILTSGAFGPILQAQLPQIRDRVNACYGYNAIARIRITQTAPDGFGAGPPRQNAAIAVKAVDTHPEAQRATDEIADGALRAALAALGSRIITDRTTD